MRAPMLVVCALAACLAPVSPANASPAPTPAPNAAQVIARGAKTLEGALRVALADSGAGEGARGPADVLLIIDVTPYVAAAEDGIAKALVALDATARGRGGWSLARLGEPPMAAVEGPGNLVLSLARALERDTTVDDTLGAIDATLDHWRRTPGTVLYLADWRVEDDSGLEHLVAKLLRRGLRLSVVGSESCFSRAWNDGFYPPDRGARLPDGSAKLYAEGIGRSPFGPPNHETPWHGGDVAWPHVPLRVTGTHWTTEFPVQLPPTPARATKGRYAEPKGGAKPPGAGTPEDLQRRAREAAPKAALERYWFPLSSSFGPYPLMRAAGVTGGRYVLWSWNPAGRSDIQYDYGRCNLFAPDLRAREEILSDIPRRPLALALLRAWHLLANRDIGVAASTPPLAADGRGPREMEEPRARWFLAHSWETPADHAEFLAAAPRVIAALEAALSRLHEALATTTPGDGVDRRYQADARLLRYVLLVQRFQVGEALAAARLVDRSAWSHPGLRPGLAPLTWIPSGADPDDARIESVDVVDAALGAALLEARRGFLGPYRGTPFGELAARNPVLTYRVELRECGAGVPTRRSPSESGGDAPTTPRNGGGSSGNGPTTGG